MNEPAPERPSSGDPPTATERLEHVLSRVTPFLGLGLVVIAGFAVHRELSGTHWRDIWDELRSVSAWRWAAALGLTALSYGALAGFEWLAARHVGLKVSTWRVLLAGALGWAVSNTVGQSWLSGGAVRMRLYSGWGVSAGDVARIVAFDSLSFALGFVTVGGFALAIDPPPPVEPWGRLIGLAMLAGLAAVIAITTVRKAPIQIGPISFQLPYGRILAAQILFASIDELAAIGALYVLLPGEATVTYPELLSMFLLSAFAGLLSGVPGGAGTLDGALITMLTPYSSGAIVVGAVLGWRIVYDLVPLGLAAAFLAAFEVRRFVDPRLGEAGELVVRFARSMAPPALAGLSFVGGMVLLVSALTPAEAQRLTFLEHFEPLALIETSHATSAAVGVALLFVARGLWMRLRAAWRLLVALLVLGGLVSVTKGLDFEEATFLLGVLLVAVPSRREFYRMSALGRESLGLPWAVAVGAAVAVTGIVLVHAYVYVPWRREVLHDDLLLTFADKADSSRSLRAFVIAGAMAGAAVLMGWLRPVRDPPPVPSDVDLDDALRIAIANGNTNGYLAALGDKALLFDADRTAFLMYGTAHGVWVCYAGPIGPPDRCADLLWTFREHADRAGARIALYEIRPQLLPLCVDLGLQAYKFGEEALVDLKAFTLEGGSNKNRRNQISKLEREGTSFAVVAREDVPALLPELTAVSDGWLLEKGVREKGFSLGFFDEGYLSRAPVAVVRREGRVVAFANVLPAGPELSVDLMRFHPDAPPGSMDYLFLSLFKWGSAQGYERFVLGMTPLAGLPERDLAPLWAKLGRFVFRNGEAFYNFQGLRDYKDKFHPQWEPRYLAVQGALALPATLRSLNALISGSMLGAVWKDKRPAL